SADAVFSVAFGPGGRLLAASGADQKVRLWNVAKPAAPVPLGKALTGPTNTAYSVAFSPDGRLLAVGSADKAIRLWDVSDPARRAGRGGVLGRVRPRRAGAGRREPRGRRGVGDPGRPRPPGADRQAARAARARLLARLRPRRAPPGRDGLGRPGLAVGPPARR